MPKTKRVSPGASWCELKQGERSCPGLTRAFLLLPISPVDYLNFYITHTTVGWRKNCLPLFLNTQQVYNSKRPFISSGEKREETDCLSPKKEQTDLKRCTKTIITWTYNVLCTFLVMRWAVQEREREGERLPISSPSDSVCLEIVKRNLHSKRKTVTTLSPRCH